MLGTSAGDISEQNSLLLVDNSLNIDTKVTLPTEVGCRIHNTISFLGGSLHLEYPTIKSTDTAIDDAI